jgi:hypothetical protein
MTIVLLWVVAGVSALLLVAGGTVLGRIRLRAHLAAALRTAQQLSTRAETAGDDRFGELQVLREQLGRVLARLETEARAAGLPGVDRARADATGPGGTAAPAAGVTAELEQDLDLFKREVYAKTKRIEALESEKQTLAEKIVGLEESLRKAGERPTGRPSTSGEPGEVTALLDALQQEADQLRARLEEKEATLRTLASTDATGMLHEVERIRKELLGRNEEIATLEVRLMRAEKQAQQQDVRAQTLEKVKEDLAARALESASELRKASERIRELEMEVASRPGVSPPAPLAPMAAPATRTAPLPAPALPPRSGTGTTASPFGPRAATGTSPSPLPPRPPTSTTASPLPPRPPTSTTASPFGPRATTNPAAPPAPPRPPTATSPSPLPPRPPAPPAPSGSPSPRPRRPTGSIFPLPKSREDSDK